MSQKNEYKQNLHQKKIRKVTLNEFLQSCLLVVCLVQTEILWPWKIPQFAYTEKPSNSRIAFNPLRLKTPIKLNLY